MIAVARIQMLCYCSSLWQPCPGVGLSQRLITWCWMAALVYYACHRIHLTQILCTRFQWQQKKRACSTWTATNNTCHLYDFNVHIWGKFWKTPSQMGSWSTTANRKKTEKTTLYAVDEILLFNQLWWTSRTCCFIVVASTLAGRLVPTPKSAMETTEFNAFSCYQLKQVLLGIFAVFYQPLCLCCVHPFISAAKTLLCVFISRVADFITLLCGLYEKPLWSLLLLLLSSLAIKIVFVLRKTLIMTLCDGYKRRLMATRVWSMFYVDIFAVVNVIHL